MIDSVHLTEPLICGCEDFFALVFFRALQDEQTQNKNLSIVRQSESRLQNFFWRLTDLLEAGVYFRCNLHRKALTDRFELTTYFVELATMRSFLAIFRAKFSARLPHEVVSPAAMTIPD